ncbi:hypothetical protein TIFTF001_047054 [Ficus carica]|uniref:Uncharacterized protein n=1 Tax=Ficus carica TaxID=3494 RepID=A0AA87YXY4_FICCA|nr:hypothetical protein TIFTF001_047039 [Ficus carica]GMN20185.1 hypothetical protein TIFTF001_047054 [Ficus carica]
MAREMIKSQVLLLMALVLSVVLLFSVVQARPLCDSFQAHDHWDVLGLWGIKSSGPSPPGAGH